MGGGVPDQQDLQFWESKVMYCISRDVWGDTLSTESTVYGGLAHLGVYGWESTLVHNDLHLVTYLGLCLGFFEDWELAKLWFN